MSPAQLRLESDSKIIANFLANKTSGRKVGNNCEIPDEKGLKCTGNFKDSPYPVKDMLNEQNKPSKVAEDVPIDVIGSKRNVDNKVAAKEDPDGTECSSSFANTTSADENSSGLSDAEVESQLYDNGGLGSSYDGLSSFFPIRKKKLTSHWRNFIRPLMWRCKWAELKIKEFEFLASKYSRSIAAYDYKKHIAFDQSRVEEFGSKSLPYTPQSHRRKPLKRRKRKKVECITDTTEYMAHHNLFSHQAETKRSDQDGSSAGDDFGNPVFPGQDLTASDDFAYNNDWLSQEENNCFNEEIFRKIDLIHIRVQKMKAQLDLIMTKYGAKFSSSESLSHLVPCDLPSSSVRSPTFSACNGDTVSAGGLYASIQQMSEYDLGDFVTPDTAVSSYGEGILIPDIIESTVGLLSSVDVTQHQAQVVDSCEKIVDNILIHNEAAEMEKRPFKQPHVESIENHQDAEISGDEESTKPLLPAIEELDKETTRGIFQEDSTLKSSLASEIHVPKNKRKRGERKAGSGGWSRQLPGEPDSQT